MATGDQGSVTRWLGPLKAGDPAAVQQLWEHYFHQLVDLARAKLQNAPRRIADEEDIALSAFNSFAAKPNRAASRTCSTARAFGGC